MDKLKVYGYAAAASDDAGNMVAKLYRSEEERNAAAYEDYLNTIEACKDTIDAEWFEKVTPEEFVMASKEIDCCDINGNNYASGTAAIIQCYDCHIGFNLFEQEI